jgi:hypothetical protein
MDGRVLLSQHLNQYTSFFEGPESVGVETFIFEAYVIFSIKLLI